MTYNAGKIVSQSCNAAGKGVVEREEDGQLQVLSAGVWREILKSCFITVCSHCWAFCSSVCFQPGERLKAASNLLWIGELCSLCSTSKLAGLKTQSWGRCRDVKSRKFRPYCKMQTHLLPLKYHYHRKQDKVNLGDPFQVYEREKKLKSSSQCISAGVLMMNPERTSYAPATGSHCRIPGGLLSPQGEGLFHFTKVMEELTPLNTESKQI